MNLILLVWRLVLAVLFPSRRDGLSLAARTDGRMQHLPQSPWDWHGVWDWLRGERTVRPKPGPRGRPARPRSERTATLPTKSPSANG